MFQIKHLSLPHEGVIPGARGHKKVLVPAGTKVYCIVYGTKMYWAVYLDEAQARRCMANLAASANGTARRSIQLDALVAWNFASRFPRRVVRLPKEVGNVT